MHRLTALFAALLLTACSAPSNKPALETEPPAPPPTASDAFVDDLAQRTFNFFWEKSDPRTGLTPDRWPTPSFSSIAAVGFALTAYPIGVERGWITRAQAAERTKATLDFFWNAPMGGQATGVTGHKGFYYHFLDMQTGHRFKDVELSTIDTSLLLGGILFCQSYFDGETPDEAAIRATADSIYRRVDWNWMQVRPPAVAHGWRPKRGFINSDWIGYDEAMILYVLALGSPTHPVEPEVWNVWSKEYLWADFQGQQHLNFAPLFGHQYSHVWIDFKGIQDAYMKTRGIDYFENSRRATYAQRAYAIENPRQYRDYGANIWGLTASDGPVDGAVMIDGQRRTFQTYAARGAGADEIRDDGTIAPTAAGGSIPFAPEIAIPALMAMRDKYGDKLYKEYGFVDAFNPTLRSAPKITFGSIDPELGWFNTDYLGIDQGPIVAMIENHRSGLIWKTMRKNPYIVRGLRRAGFTGGWLNAANSAQ